MNMYNFVPMQHCKIFSWYNHVMAFRNHTEKRKLYYKSIQIFFHKLLLKSESALPWKIEYIAFFSFNYKINHFLICYVLTDIFSILNYHMAKFWYLLIMGVRRGEVRGAGDILSISNGTRQRVYNAHSKTSHFTRKLSLLMRYFWCTQHPQSKSYLYKMKSIIWKSSTLDIKFN